MASAGYSSWYTTIARWSLISTWEQIVTLNSKSHALKSFSNLKVSKITLEKRPRTLYECYFLDFQQFCRLRVGPLSFMPQFALRWKIGLNTLVVFIFCLKTKSKDVKEKATSIRTYDNVLVYQNVEGWSLILGT